MGTQVYRFGARKPCTHGEAVAAQMDAAGRYRNDLARLEQRRREKLNAEMCRLFANVRELTARYQSLDEAIEKARAAQRARNAVERNRHISDEERQAIQALVEQREETSDRLKKAKAEAYGPDYVRKADEAFRKERKKLRTETRKRNVSHHASLIEAEKRKQEAYQRWFAEIPWAREWVGVMQKIEDDATTEQKRLYAHAEAHWGTKCTIDKAAQSFRQGPPPCIKHYHGEGMIGVQVQKGLPVRDALNATKGQLSIEQYDPSRDRVKQNGKMVALKQKAHIRMRIDEDGNWTDIPVKIHRHMPEDAEIMWAHLHRRRVGTMHKYAVNFTLRRADWKKPDLANCGQVGIDIGWRLVPSGMRVAYWVGNDGRKGELILPQRWIDRMNRVEEIQGERDTLFDCIKSSAHRWIMDRWETIPQWLKERSVKPDKKTEEKPTKSTIYSWKAIARLASVILYWKGRRFEGDGEIYDMLEKWRAADAKQYDHQERLRSRTLGWRREIYRVFAATLRKEYRTACMEDIDWAKMKKNAEAEESSMPPGTKENMTLGAPGMLQEIISAAMGETVWREAKNTTRLHFSCGQLSGEQNRANLLHTCVHCNVSFDQDENAAIVLLRGLTPPAKKRKKLEPVL